MLKYEEHIMEIVFMNGYVWTLETASTPSDDDDTPWGKMY